MIITGFFKLKFSEIYHMNIQGVKCISEQGKLNIDIKIAKLRQMVYGVLDVFRFLDIKIEREYTCR